MSNKVKPCPFCGSAAVSKDHADQGWFIACSDGDICDFSPRAFYSTEAEAVSKWNARSADRQRDELLEMLIQALPVVEDAESDQNYKPGYVTKVAKKMKSLIEKLEV